MNSRELPFREIDGSSFLMLPEGAAGMGDPSGAGDVVPRDEGSRHLAGVKHHVGAAECPVVAGDVVPRDERSRLWPEGGTTSASL